MEKVGNCSRSCLDTVCEGMSFRCKGGTMSLSRSLGQTLIAAASTMAFFAAFNCQFALIVSSTPGTLKRWLKQIALALAEPFYAYAYSVLSAFIMWCAKRKLPAPGKLGWGQDIAIILNCPLFIEIPPAYCEVAAALYLERSRLAAKGDKNEILEGVDIPSRSMDNMDSMVDSKDKISEVENEVLADVENPSRSRHKMDSMVDSNAQISEDLTDEETKVLKGWMKGLEIESEHTIKDWHSAELPAILGKYKDIPENTRDSRRIKERYYVKLNPSPFYPRDVHERFLLLEMDLVLENRQMHFLRSRSTFQAVVTTVQALGYVLGVVERMVLSNPHVEVSPLEAILVAFDVLVILQLVFNMYTCVHYQRPLILRLHHSQFSAYIRHERLPRYKILRYPFLDSNTSKIFLCTGAVISLALPVMIQFAFIRYALSYLHPHGPKYCLLCSLSAFIFCLLALSAVMLIAILNSKRFREYSAQAKLSFVIHIYSSIINIASIALALAATITRWNVFSEPTVNVFAWIIPHVAS